MDDHNKAGRDNPGQTEESIGSDPHADPEHASDLTLFQVSTLTVLGDGPDYGLGIKRSLEAYYDEEINHGRLYPNLDQLVERGLIEKSAADKRTNRYELTSEGVAVLRDRAAWLLAHLGEEAEIPSEAHRQGPAEPARGDD